MNDTMKPRPIAYTIPLTESDWDTIDFVGYRYAWSSALQALRPAEGFTLALAEYEAWELGAAFDNDTLGGHGAFPMLATDSDLYAKLLAFWDGLV